MDELDAMDLMGADLFDTGIPVEEEVLDETEAQAIVRRQLEDALNWREENLERLQEEATDYYMGRPFGNERPNRSKVVATEVRDAIRAVMPSLIEVLLGTERAVEFQPTSVEDTALASQQTDYISHIVREDNPGFTVLYSAWKDALVRKLGVVKWWWEDKTRVEGSQHTGLTLEDAQALVMAEAGEEVDYDIQSEGEEDAENPTFSVDLRRIIRNGRARIEAVPPEEFVFSPDARSLQDARLVGHVRDMHADDLIAMGVPQEMIDHAGTRARERYADGLADARRVDRGSHAYQSDDADDATRPIQFAELYVKLDLDGDGIAELRRITCVGDSCEFFENDVVDERPFALFCPDPEPHTLVGLSYADLVKDLQEINSAIMRGMLDSLAMSLDQSVEVVEGKVNIKDLQNSEVGRIIRVTQPGMMREMAPSFVGREALNVLEFMARVKENRTGNTRAASGLDPDSLQSATQAAVAATISASQQQMKMLARVFAETGMRDLYKGLLRLVVRHQDHARVVRMRNEFVAVDPRHWNADLDVQVNVGKGAGNLEEKLAMLGQIAAKQEQILQEGAPLVRMSQYRNTLAKMVELAGFPDASEFFLPFGAEEDQAYEQQKAQAAQNAPPSETEVFQQVEMAKIQNDQQKSQMDAQLKATIEMQKLELEKEKLAREFTLKRLEMQQKAAKTTIDAQVAAEKLRLQDEKQENDAVLGAVDRIQRG